MAQQTAGPYLPVVEAHPEVNDQILIVKNSSCGEAGHAIAAIVKDIESFLRRRDFGTLTLAQAQRIGNLRQGLADQHHNLIASNEAWRAWRGDKTDTLFHRMESWVTDI